MDGLLSEATTEMKKLQRYVIYGAGGIGGTIGMRLHQAGCNVCLIARGDHADVIRQHGLVLRTPAGEQRAKLPCVTHPAQLDWLQTKDELPPPVVLLCMKSQHTEAALRDLSHGLRADLPIVCVQNGVANERIALRYYRQVYATVVNLPALHLVAGEVVSYADGHGGILDTGCFPAGVDDLCRGLVADLTSAGFSALAKPDVMRQKYAKLLLNLGNVLQAALPMDDEVKGIGRDARKEALSCYVAANIDCSTQDEVQELQAGIYRAADVPGIERGGGSSWQSIARGAADIETEYLNGEICMLGRLHGISTPVNDACVVMARELLYDRIEPGQYPKHRLSSLIDRSKATA